MDKFKFINKNLIKKLPLNSGVYIFKDKKNILYIGKAGNIKKRVQSHFNQPSYKNRCFLEKIIKIGFLETNSQIEALILESKLIKKYQPNYNILWKDDKNYFYVSLTKEKNPRISITHQPKDTNNKHIGPFVDGNSLKKTLIILRKIFPYYSQKKHPKNPCPWCHLKLCPGPNPDTKKYRKDINNLKNILEGKSQTVLKKIKKEMAQASKNQNFEKASESRDKIIFLQKTLDNVKILTLAEEPENWEEIENNLKKIIKTDNPISRIEAYDISNIQGKMAAGSMVVFINGKPAKNLYRKFKIKMKQEPNDTAMIKEVLKRRISHKEWPLPDIFLIDGGKGQLNAAKSILKKNNQKNLSIIAIAKKNNELFIENKKKPLLLKNLSREIFNLILRLRDEAHRFAINYHKKLREIDLGLKK